MIKIDNESLCTKYYSSINLYSGEAIAQARNWRSQDWGWNTPIQPPVTLIDTISTISTSGNQTCYSLMQIIKPKPSKTVIAKYFYATLQ